MTGPSTDDLPPVIAVESPELEELHAVLVGGAIIGAGTPYARQTQFDAASDARKLRATAPRAGSIS